MADMTELANESELSVLYRKTLSRKQKMRHASYVCLGHNAIAGCRSRSVTGLRGGAKEARMRTTRSLVAIAVFLFLPSAPPDLIPVDHECFFVFVFVLQATIVSAWRLRPSVI